MLWRIGEDRDMMSKKCVSAIAITAFMVLSSVLVMTSQRASAFSWLTTTDTDFNTPGSSYFPGGGYETVLHGTGAAAYVQNKKDMTNWIQKFPVTDTGPRSGFGFANDSLESRFILFGGRDGSSMGRNDTWEYNYAAANWEQICNDNTPACAPPARIWPGMAYDNNSKVAVMYGGWAADYITRLEDTWEYDVVTNTWTNHSTGTHPQRVDSVSMVYDAKDKRVIMVGAGQTGMEVWAYDVVAHAWTQKATGGPSIRTGFALGYNYEAGYQRVVLYGGAWMLTLYDETWEWNYASSTWQQVSPSEFPSARSGASMTYNFKTSLEGLILWGGNSWSTETWKYNHMAGTPTWSQVLTTTAPSPPRQTHGLAYDPGYDALVIYGGEPFTGNRLNDTWFLEAGYKVEGKYASAFFNTYDTATSWDYIFWNQTPSSLPASQWMRFQTNVSHTCNNADLATWQGPGLLTSQYYTSPGQAIDPGNNGFECLRFLADMATFDPSSAPRLEDVGINYHSLGPIPPKVASVSPTMTGNPTNAWIYINFTKPMDTTTVRVNVTPYVRLDPPNWYGGNMKVYYTHNTQPFLEAKRYDVCVWGNDTLGQPLNYPGGKYCWLFTTLAVAPFIQSTDPQANQVDVLLTAPVVITFSEPMDTTTCWPYVTIDPPVVFSHAWSNGDRTLTMTHSTDFLQFTRYTVNVPIGDSLQPCLDKSGILLTVGPTAVPWSFTTLAINPYITSTDPMNLEVSVPVNVLIKVTFSRDMQASSMSYAFKEYNGVSWSNSSVALTPAWTSLRALQFSHTTNLAYCRPFQMQIWALDTTGKSLIKNTAWANPWRFQTTGSAGTCGPYIISTTPADGEQDVPTWKNVTIAFHYDPFDTGGMNRASFTYSVKDGYGNELNDGLRFQTNWLGMGPGAVELLHPNYTFSRCQDYTIKVITARDNSGRALIPGMGENPFTFRTISTNCNPVILWTQPVNGTLNAPLTQDIKVKFSKPIDPLSFSIGIRNPLFPYGYTWTENNTNVTVTHTAYTACEWYNATVFAVDTERLPLDRGPVPNPWMWRGFCIQGPYIMDTDPVNGQTGVPLMNPIWVNFSEPMNNGSLQFTLFPSAGTTSYEWSNGDMTVKITHSSPLIECDLYTASVVDATNKSGGHLVGGGAPNPWKFRAKCVPPQIISTIPFDTATGVLLDATITVIFSEPIEATSLIFHTVPGGSYVPTWPNAQTVVLSHGTPWLLCQPYLAQVDRARDVDGNDLVAGLIPNPWNFTTDCRFQVKGLKVQRQAPDVRLTWTADPAVLYWNVYHSTNRLAPWPSWTMIQNITTPSNNFYVHPGAISDMQNHFYIVRGFKTGGWSSNSTMGALWHPQLSPLAGKTSAFWFSVPYNSIYKKARDITDELDYPKINVVAKWDPSRQQSILYYYLHGQWRGTNFNIVAGDGLWIGVFSTFDWAINGTDSSKSTIFSFRPTLRSNIYWFGLPYTSKYATASQIVLDIAGGIGPGNNTMIVAVGKWVYNTQSSEIYRWSPTGWGGVDFAIGSGDGIWIEVVSTFAWTPKLITPEVP